MRFTNYNFGIVEFYKFSCKKCRDFKKMTFLEFWKYMIKKELEFNMLQKSHIPEMVYRECKNPTNIFIDSELLPEFLTKQKYDVQQDVLEFYPECATIHFMENCKINTVPLSSILICKLSEIDIRNYINNKLQIHTIPINENNWPDTHPAFANKKLLFLYDSVHQQHKEIKEKTHGFHSTTGFNKFLKADLDELNIDNGSRKIIGFDDEGRAIFHPIPESKLNNMELIHQQNIMKLIAGISVYARCFPEAIVQGVPKSYTFKNGAKNNAITINGNETSVKESHAMRSPHYRSGHFRTLTSERFINKRGKTIFISACFVGMKTENKTVVEI